MMEGSEAGCGRKVEGGTHAFRDGSLVKELLVDPVSGESSDGEQDGVDEEAVCEIGRETR